VSGGRAGPAALPTIRVGMPLPAGRLLEYGIMSGLPLMFSANAFAKYRDGSFRGFRLNAASAIPPNVDAALDSAGFTAAAHYGDYRFSVSAYLDLVATRDWAFWSAMDYCVEPAIAQDASMRRLRIDATIARYWECADKAATRKLKPPLPVIQGLMFDEYARCAEQMGISSATPLVGIGSVCRRHLYGPDGVLAVVSSLDTVLPKACKLHLFGLKGAGTLGVLVSLFPHRIGSTDSMAYNMAVRRSRPVGRDQEMRAMAMIDWHRRESDQLQAYRPREGLVDLPPHRERTAEDLAMEAVGAALGDLLLSNDASYRVCRSMLRQDAIIVQYLLATEGVHAFAEEEPDDDRGLGIVYGVVREALIDHGLLAAA